MTQTVAPQMNAAEQDRAAARRASGKAYAVVFAVCTWWCFSWLANRLGFRALERSTATTLMIAVLVSLPWFSLALIARWRGIVHADGGGDHRGVGVLFQGACLMLAGTALSDNVDLMGWAQLLRMVALGGAAFSAFVLWLDPRPGRGFSVLTLIVCCVGYAYGAVHAADTVFGPAPQRLSVPVLGKKMAVSVGGRAGATAHFYLSIGPWGPRGAPSVIGVDRATFDAVTVGGTVCITLGAGALGIPWYSTAACR